jgi:hypothetical protein
MKVIRIASIVLVAGLVCAVLLVCAALYSPFQTWAVRRVLSSRADARGSVESFAAVPGKVSILGLRLERNGIVLTLPSVEADLPIVRAKLWHRVAIRRLVARGWVLDLTKAPAGAAAGNAARVLNPAEAARGPLAGAEGAGPAPQADPAGLPSRAEQAAMAFRGIFADLRLPFDLSLDDVELEGDVMMRNPNAGASAPLTVHVIFYGGGLATGREGRFTFNATAARAASADEPVNAMTVSGTLGATMDTPRSFTRAAVHIRAAARGLKLPNGVRLSADFSGSKGPFGETYALSLTGETKELATMAAGFSSNTGKVSGTWKLDIRDDDLEPFAFGRPLPLFDLVGSGRFDSDASLYQTQVSGSLNATADRLAAVGPEFSAIGAVKLAADFDITRRGSLYRFDHLRAALSGAQPVLTIQGLQAFAFNAGTGELQVADATRDLVGVTLQGVPLDWARPFLPGVELAGSPVRGEIVALAGGGGLALRTRSPLEFAWLSVARNGRPLVSDIELQLEFAMDYTPQGWQIEVSRCAGVGPATGGGVQVGGPPDLRPFLFTLSGKCGRLAGAKQPIKLAGRLDAQLPAILAQPGIASMLRPGADSALASGKLACDFSANLAEQRMVETRLSVSNLVLVGPIGAGVAGADAGQEGLVPVADITSNARFDIGADGRAAVTMPLLFQKGGVKSDATLTGTVFLDRGTVVVEGDVASANIACDQLAPLVALFGTGKAAPAGAQGNSQAAIAPKHEPAPDAAPAWAGFGGQLKVSLARLEHADTILSGVSGTLRAEASSLQVDGFRVGFADGGEARVNGSLTFAPRTARPYSLRADLAIDDLNAAEVFRTVNSDSPPTVEGKFDLAAHVLGDGASLADLANRIRGDCQATSKGGTFRMLSPGFAAKAESVGKIEAAVAYLGSLPGAITGRKDNGDMSSLAQAVNSFAKMLRPIQYDQLSVVLSRGESLDTVLSEFTLIAPEIRLSGGGRLSNQEGLSILAQPISMDFKLRARGHEAALLKYLGALDPKQPDDLGYLPCTLPIHIAGTLAKPDQSQFDAALSKLAVEKGGAGELLNKLLGK